MDAWDAERFARLAADMHDERTVEGTLDSVLTGAREALGCDYAAVLFVHGPGRVETAAASDPLVGTFDRLQTQLGEGPDLRALENLDPVLVPDTRDDTRWPRWSAAVADAGIRSMLAVPLVTELMTVGTLNYYDRRPGHFDHDSLSRAGVFARHATVAIAGARNVANLWAAVDVRRTVGQAQGILMQRYRLSELQAMDVLMRYTQETETRLADVAATVVASLDMPRHG